MLEIALAEARKGLAEGGLPIGAAIFDATGNLVGAGHNRRVQDGDPSMHAETNAFRNAGRQHSYRNLIMVTTLAPCWYCSGLVRQFGFRDARGRRKPQFSGRRRMAALARRQRHRPRFAGVLPRCSPPTSKSTPKSGTRISGRSEVVAGWKAFLCVLCVSAVSPYFRAFCHLRPATYFTFLARIAAYTQSMDRAACRSLSGR